jgi:oligopeptide/dipeptide ABC transporter ATP-binding protein
VSEPLLAVQDVSVGVRTGGGIVTAVDRVSFTVGDGQLVCVVGESGSGKTLTALAVMRLLDRVGARLLGGRVILQGQDLYQGGEKTARGWRGSRIALIPQEPLSALDPLFSVRSQLAEAIRAHRRVRGRGAMHAQIADMLAAVGLDAPAERARDFPHQLSGGMRQRVLIAMALLGEPALLVADEPTTSLDVTVQAQVLALIRDITRERKMAVLLVTHDMGIAAQMADSVIVMYAGRIVESGAAQQLLASPRHPYTRDLLAAVPTVDGARTRRLVTISGQVPAVGRVPPGCAYHPRCRLADDVCRASVPPLESAAGRELSCWHPVASPDGPAAPSDSRCAR